MKKLKSNLDRLSKLIHSAKREQTILCALRPHLNKISQAIDNLLSISTQMVDLSYDLIEHLENDKTQEKEESG